MRNGVEQKNGIPHICRRDKMVSDTDIYAPETRITKYGVGVSIAISRWVGSMSIFAIHQCDNEQ